MKKRKKLSVLEKAIAGTIIALSSLNPAYSENFITLKSNLALLNPYTLTTPNLTKQRIYVHKINERVKEEKKYKEKLKKYNVPETFSEEIPGRLYVPVTIDDIVIATGALFAEARGEYKNQEYLDMVAKTIFTRAYESGKYVSEVIQEKGQFTYLNDNNKVKLGNAEKIANKNAIEKAAYNACRETIINLFDKGISPEELVTHYYVSSVNSENHPKWAKTKNKIKTIAHKNNLTRFYYIPNTRG
jgi:hypothetical protein